MHKKKRQHNEFCHSIYYTTVYTTPPYHIILQKHAHKKGDQHEDLLAYTMEVISNKMNGHLLGDMEEEKKKDGCELLFLYVIRAYTGFSHRFVASC